MSKIQVAIVDYGLGNLFSINQACEYFGLTPVITSSSKVIAESDALILPGVGAFGNAMNYLKENFLIEPLLNFAKTGKPFLGICLGMQLLFSESEEFGNYKGLNLIEGKILRFPPKNKNGQINRIPQINWNQIYLNSSEEWKKSPLQDIEDGDYMYFVHSYYAAPKNLNSVLSFTDFGGIRYASSTIFENIIGMQFHPEKSGAHGLKIYKRWIESIKKN
jgi:glutamine amidotransferase